MKNEVQPLGEKLNRLEVTPPVEAWAAVEAALNQKKGFVVWFPAVAAVVLFGLLGLSAMIFMESANLKGLSPEVEQILLPQGLDIGSGTVTYEETVDKSDEIVEEVVVPRETVETPLKEGAGKSRGLSSTRLVQKQLDPFTEPLGAQIVSTDLPATKTIKVSLNKIEKAADGAGIVKPEKEPLLSRIDPDEATAGNVIKQIKKLKDPSSWNLPQVELRLPRVFDNLKPKPKTEEK